MYVYVSPKEIGENRIMLVDGIQFALIREDSKSHELIQQFKGMYVGAVSHVYFMLNKKALDVKKCKAKKKQHCE